MQNLSKYFVGAFIVLAIMGGGMASALPIAPVEQPTNELNPQTLTVKFGPAPEFNAKLGATTQGGPAIVRPVSNVEPIPSTASKAPVSTVPEPSTILLLGAGVLGILGLARKRKANIR